MGSIVEMQNSRCMGYDGMYDGYSSQDHFSRFVKQ